MAKTKTLSAASNSVADAPKIIVPDAPQIIVRKKPLITLYDYQKRWMYDKSRFKYGLFSRQTGKSFVSSLEAAYGANTEKRCKWILLSAGMRQSLELMEKVKMHCKAMQAAASEIDAGIYTDKDIEYTQLKIVLNNGSQIIGLPANPDTARGYSGHVVLDEFAFHTDSRGIWKALFPSISKGYKIRIVTTPQGFGNMAHELWNNGNYSKHFLDIYTAIKEGCPMNAAELKEGLGDDEAWAQEFECQFIDDSTILLSYELITACQDVTLTQPIKLEEFSWDYDIKSTGGRLTAGLDVGRKKDLSVLTIVEQVGDVYWDRLILEMPKTDYTTQQNTAKDIVRKYNISKLSVDATGIGNMLAENLAKDLGESRVDQVMFTNDSKELMATFMLKTFQDRKTRISVDRDLRNDLHKIKRSATPSGKVKFDADSDDKGHADRFWSKALALKPYISPVAKCGCIWL